MIGRRALAPFLALAFPPAGARAQLFNPGAPTLAARDGLIAPSSPAWSPLDLGASLLAWWDAERADLITQSGGPVSSWRDIVGGYDAAQGTGANQPIYGAASFNSRPGVAFNGTTHELTVAAFPASFPINAAAGEIWVATDQQAPGTDALVRAAASLGNGTAAGRALERTVTASVNRCNARVGDGTSKTAGVATVDFSGRHVVRLIADGTTIWSEIDGIKSAGVACVPTTTGSRVRLGAGASAAAGSWWQGIHSAVLVTSLLTAQQADQLRAWLAARA